MPTSARATPPRSQAATRRRAGRCSNPTPNPTPTPTPTPTSTPTPNQARRALLDFHQAHYVAPQMSLAVRLAALQPKGG